jgi:hypothetical protein
MIINSENIPFQVLDLGKTPPTEHKGDTGTAFWHTCQFEGLRVRLVEYTAHYTADHWCQKGHIVHCLSGSFTSEMADGTQHILSQGMTYIVSDDLSSHRSVTGNEGVKLLIVDGDFLKKNV